MIGLVMWDRFELPAPGRDEVRRSGGGHSESKGELMDSRFLQVQATDYPRRFLNWLKRDFVGMISAKQSVPRAAMRIRYAKRTLFRSSLDVAGARQWALSPEQSLAVLEAPVYPVIKCRT